MLARELVEEGLFEPGQGGILLARDRNSLGLIFGRVHLNEGLELVIIDIVW